MSAGPESRSSASSAAEPTSRADSSPRPAAEVAAAAVRGTAPPVSPSPGPETELWRGRISWRYFAGRITLWILGSGAGAAGISLVASRAEWLTSRTAALIITAMIAISAVIVLGGILLRVLGTQYRLTSQRLFITRGILSHTVDQTELVRVDDVRLFMTLLGRMLNVGAVTVITTDATDRNIQIEGIREPTTVAEAIRERMRALRGRSVYVESL